MGLAYHDILHLATIFETRGRRMREAAVESRELAARAAHPELSTAFGPQPPSPAQLKEHSEALNAQANVALVEILNAADFVKRALAKPPLDADTRAARLNGKAGGDNGLHLSE